MGISDGIEIRNRFQKGVSARERRPREERDEKTYTYTTV